jgi:flagellar basal-body rod protein FlgC
MINALDISTSALVAQRTRLNVISGNIANLNSVHNENGKTVPYQARFTVFESDPEVGTPDGAMGVKVQSVETDKAQPVYRYQPDHPHAIQDGEWKGYVASPNIDLTSQMVDALEATRAYEANLGVIDISKGMSRETLSILA